MCQTMYSLLLWWITKQKGKRHVAQVVKMVIKVVKMVMEVSSENGDGSSEDCDRSSDSNASKTSTFVSRLSSYSFSLSLRSNGVLSTFLDPWNTIYIHLALFQNKFFSSVHINFQPQYCKCERGKLTKILSKVSVKSIRQSFHELSICAQWLVRTCLLPQNRCRTIMFWNVQIFQIKFGCMTLALLILSIT